MSPRTVAVCHGPTPFLKAVLGHNSRTAYEAVGLIHGAETYLALDLKPYGLAFFRAGQREEDNPVNIVIFENTDEPLEDLLYASVPPRIYPWVLTLELNGFSNAKSISNEVCVEIGAVLFCALPALHGSILVNSKPTATRQFGFSIGFASRPEPDSFVYDVFDTLIERCGPRKIDLRYIERPNADVLWPERPTSAASQPTTPRP